MKHGRYYEYKKRWAEEHKEAVRLSREKWRKANPDKDRLSKELYNQRNAEKVRAMRRIWKSANKKKLALASKLYRERNLANCLARELAYRAKNRERENQRTARWAKNNPARVAFLARKHQTAKRNATPKWANEFFIEEAYLLAALRTKLTGIKWHVDHIVPLQHPLVCGLHVEQNLQVIPAEHNRVKSNRYWPGMPVDFDLSERKVQMK